MDDLAPPQDLKRVETLVDMWLAEQLESNPVVVGVDKQAGSIEVAKRWIVRVAGEEKDFSAVWFTLHQRTLHYETYVVPAPEENATQFYEHLLRRNMGFNGVAFAIGEEGAVFLVGRVPIQTVDEGELDRILGSLYAYVEQCFRPALRIGFATRLGGQG